MFDDINIQPKSFIKYRTEIRLKETDFEGKEEDHHQKGQTNISTRKDSNYQNNSRAEILVNMRCRKKLLAKGVQSQFMR